MVLQDNICGGIINATSKSQAREKLSKQRGINMCDDMTLIYPLYKECFDEFGVCDLW